MKFFTSIAMLAAGAALAASLHAGAEVSPAPRPAAGWRMELLLSAPKLRHPTVVCTSPDGRIFVAEDPMDISTPHADAAEGSIKCLHPDGSVTVFATNLHAIFGMQYLEGKLFVLHNPQFSVFVDVASHGTNRVDLVPATHPNPWALDWNDHVPSNFRLGLDGYFYVATGDKGLYGATGTDGRRLDMQLGGVFRLRPDGTGLEKFCDGVRNILDVAITSEDELFTYDNTDEHEWMGRLTHMVDGGFYGYPFDFIPRRPYTLWMLADYGPGAATGAFAYTDDAMPAGFRDNLFLADFGQRNIRRVILERAGGTFREVRSELLFPDPPPDFRPVGIHETEDGRGLLICDWQHLDNKQNVTVGRLWRLTNEIATNAAPRPAWFVPAALGKKNTAAEDALLAALNHPARRVRLAAQRELQARLRQGGSLQPALVKILGDPQASSIARTHALWALTPQVHDAVVAPDLAGRVEALLADSNPVLVRQALRWLGEHQVATAAPAMARHLSSRDPSLRFQAATALGRMTERTAVSALLTALAQKETDLWPRCAMFTALNRIGRAHPDAWPLIVRGLDASDTGTRDAVRFALRETFDGKLVEALANAARDPAQRVSSREAALRLLATVHRQPPAWKGEWWAYHPYRLQPPDRIVDWAGTPMILAALRNALAESDGSLRLAAIEGLQSARDRESAGTIRVLAGNLPSIAIRAAAIRALGDLGDQESAGVIAPLLEAASGSAELRTAALEAAGRLCATVQPPPARLVTALLRLLTESAPERLQLDAIDAIVHAHLTNATAQLITAAQSPAPALREAAVRALAGFGGPAALASLSRLVREGPVATRCEAIAALGRLRNKSSLPLLLDAAKQSETRNAALAALTELPAVEAVPAYLEALGGTDVVLRDKTRRALAEISEAALPVIEARAAELSPGVRAELRRVFEGNAVALAKPFLVATDNDTPSADDYAKYALTSTGGDAWRGQRVFFDEQRVACIRCHAVHGWGGEVGPELTTAGAQFGRAALIEAILYPSRSVREGYQQVEFELRNGESFSGVVKAESGSAVTVIAPDGRSRELPRGDITGRRVSKLSMMPEGLQAVLSLADFIDLIAYLESLKTDPRRAPAVATPAGWQPLLNGRDLSGWHSVEGRDANKNPVRPPRDWAFHDGLVEHDGVGNHLWTDREFGDFALRFDWRWVDAPKWEEFPIINQDGWEARGPAGVFLHERVLDSGDSGVFVRGHFPAQANLFCYPVGSGEFWELREASLGEVKRVFIPRRRPDRALGQWNRMELTVRSDTITVMLNGEEVVSSARIPGLPARGPIGFQHEHGRLQIANVFLRDL